MNPRNLLLTVLATVALILLPAPAAAQLATENWRYPTLPGEFFDGTIHRDSGGTIRYFEDVTAIGIGVGDHVEYEVLPDPDGDVAINIRLYDPSDPPPPDDEGAY